MATQMSDREMERVMWHFLQFEHAGRGCEFLGEPAETGIVNGLLSAAMRVDDTVARPEPTESAIGYARSSRVIQRRHGKGVRV